MNKRTNSLWLGCTLVLLCGMALFVAQLNAQPPNQESPSPSQPTAQQAQPATAQPQQQPTPSGQQAPGSQAQTQSQSAKGQVFTGSVVKAGDKYVLQDSAGKTYDIDRQDLAKQHEGKKVTIQGTLDPDGKTIHVQ